MTTTESFVVDPEVWTIMRGICIFCVVFVGFLSSCHYINEHFGLSEDNLIEQCAEGIFEHYTGVDIDFTPASGN